VIRLACNNIMIFIHSSPHHLQPSQPSTTVTVTTLLPRFALILTPHSGDRFGLAVAPGHARNVFIDTATIRSESLL
jgi:hypothetical protein